VQEFDFGLVRNGDPWKFKHTRKVEEAYVVRASICFLHKASPKICYFTHQVEIKAVLVSQGQQMGFVAVWDLSNLIKWAQRVTFVSYMSGWVGGWVGGWLCAGLTGFRSQ
jgi:hypothetical protein